MIVRSHLPWPWRLAAAALVLGLGSAIGVSAFQAGSRLAGVGAAAHTTLERLQDELARLRAEHERLLAVAHSAESLLKAEQAAQRRLAEQLKRTEAENLALKSDLGFFERLLPVKGAVSIRALQAEAHPPGHTRYQLLVMQPGKSPPEFRGRYEVTLTGTLDGKPWSFTPSDSVRPMQMTQYLRVEGLVAHPPEAVVKAVEVKVIDTSGGIKATQSATV